MRRLKTIHGPGITLQELYQARHGMHGSLRQGRAQSRMLLLGHGLQIQLALHPNSNNALRMPPRQRQQQQQRSQRITKSGLVLHQHPVSHYLPSLLPLCRLLLPLHQSLQLPPVRRVSQTLCQNPCVRPRTRTHCLSRLTSRNGLPLSSPSLRQPRALLVLRPCHHPSPAAPRLLLAS